MSEEKQIEEMIEIVKPFVSGLACGDESGACELTDCLSCKARNLVNQLRDADYRKQREGLWVLTFKTKFAIPLPKMDVVMMCSECGYKPDIYSGEYKKYNYCPNCGAKIKGADK